MSIKSVIYQIRNLITNKLYVGSALNRSKRWAWHKYKLNLNDHSNRYLQRAWNKYGEAAFEFRVIEFVDDKSKLLEREQFWIDWMQCCNPAIGYNIRKQAASNIGVVFSKETRAKMSMSKIGNKVNLGRTHSEETKAKMSLSRKGKPKSKEHVAKVVLANSKRKRLPHSEERKQKIRNSMKLTLANKRLWATCNGIAIEIESK